MTNRPKANSNPTSDGSEDEAPAKAPKQDETSTAHGRTVLEQHRADLVNRAETLRGSANTHLDHSKNDAVLADEADRQLAELDKALKVLQENS